MLLIIETDHLKSLISLKVKVLVVKLQLVQLKSDLYEINHIIQQHYHLGYPFSKFKKYNKLDTLI